jgi:hypothetical protein
MDVHLFPRSPTRGYMNSGHRKYWKSTPGHSAIKTRELFGINRNHLRHVMGLLAGHCHMKGHLFELELVNSSSCKRCQKEGETASHILRVIVRL